MLTRHDGISNLAIIRLPAILSITRVRLDFYSIIYMSILCVPGKKTEPTFAACCHD